MAMCSLLIVYHESSKAWIQTCAEYKHTGRKMSSTYLDINEPNGSINGMEITTVCCQHLFSKSYGRNFDLFSPLVPYLLSYLQ